jgi:hypothetical protein
MHDETTEQNNDTATEQAAWTAPAVEVLSERDVFALMDTQACGAAPSATNDPDCAAA